MTLIPFREAQRILGIGSGTLFQGSKKYEKYMYKGEGFDILGYQKEQELLDRVKQMTALFVEYLHHIEGLSYYQMGKVTGVNAVAVGDHSFGVRGALKILSTYARVNPEVVERFDSYYNFKRNNTWDVAKIERITHELF